MQDSYSFVVALPYKCNVAILIDGQVYFCNVPLVDDVLVSIFVAIVGALHPDYSTIIQRILF